MTNKTKFIPYKVMATSALTTMTVVSGLGLNALSANASQVNNSQNNMNTSLTANTNTNHSQLLIRKESETNIQKQAANQRFINQVNHVVRDDNVNYDNNSRYYAVEPEDMTLYNLNINTVQKAITGNVQAQQTLANDIISTNLDPHDQTDVIQSYNFLRASYLHENKHAVYVTATRTGHVYKDAKLTQRANKTFHEDALFKIKRIWSVRGKQRFELADGNFISGYHAVINQDFTNVKMLTHYFDNVKYVGHKSRNKLASKYYVKTPKGKRHVAITKKTVVKHLRKNFGDFSSLKKGNHVRKGIKLRFRRVIRHGNVFRLQLTNGHYVTASKAFVRIIK